MSGRSRSGAGVFSAAAVATLMACKLGGPSADPEAYLVIPEDASADASVSGSTPDVDSTAPSDDAGAADGESVGPSDVEDAGGGSLTICRDASSVAVCDPVHNTGCNPFQQCDVDPGQNSTPTGLCLFNGAQVDGGACSMSLVSETCPPKSTCVTGACRQLCACDTDCPAGECCSDMSGPPGFVLCGACP